MKSKNQKKERGQTHVFARPLTRWGTYLAGALSCVGFLTGSTRSQAQTNWVVVNGITNSAIGNVTLNVSSNQFQIVSVVSTQEFGAAMNVQGWHYSDIQMGAPPTVPAGTVVKMRTYGMLNGVSNQLITTVTCTNISASNFVYTVDFSPVGAVANTVAVYDGTNLAANMNSVTGAVAQVAGEGLAGNWTPLVVDGGQLWFTLDLPTRPAITLPGAPPVNGTRLVVTPEANKITFPTTPIIVTPHIAVDWPHWLPWWKPPFPWPPPPWPDPGDPPPYLVAVGALSRIEVVAQGISQLNILKEQAGMYGFTHDVFLETPVQGNDDRFTIKAAESNWWGITFPSRFAVNPSPLGADKPPINLKVQWQYPVPPTCCCCSAYLQVNVNGSLGGLSNQILGSVRAFKTTSNTVAFLPDFGKLNSSQTLVEIYSGDSPVHVEFVISNIVVGTAFPWPMYFHGPIPICDPRFCDPPPGDITFGWNSNVVFHLPSGTNVFGDRIRFQANPSPQPSIQFESFGLLFGDGFTDLTIIKEEFLPPGQMFNGFGHLAIGSFFDTTVSNELVVSNLVANSYFGTSVDIGDADGGDFSLIGPDDSSLDGSTLQVRAFGTLRGLPDQLLGSIVATKAGTNIQFAPDLTPIGGHILNITVLDGITPVGVSVGVTNPVITVPSKLRLAWVAGWQEFQNAFLRGYIHLPERTTVKIPSWPPVTGTDILIDVCLTCGPIDSPAMGRKSVTRFELIGGGLPYFQIGEERLSKFGLLHSRTGSSRLAGSGHDLRVVNPVSGLNNSNGVKLAYQWQLGGSGLLGLTQIDWRPMNQYGTISAGAILRGEVQGAFVNLGEQVLGSSQITDQGFQKEISADFSMLGAASQRIDVLSNNLVVFTANMPTGMVVHPNPSDWPLGCGTVVPHPRTNSIVWRFWPPVQFEINNQFVTGDELRLTPLTSAPTLDHISSLTLTSQGIDELQFVSDSFQSSAPINLQIQRFGNGVGIGWVPFNLGEVLQCATRVTGPYWDVPGAAFPFYVTPITSTNRFYRVRHPFPQDNGTIP